MSVPVDNFDASGGRRGGPRRPRMALYAAVTAVSALIVLLWAMIVPPELGSFSLFSEKDRRGWEEIKAVTDAQNAEFQRTLGAMRASLEAATADAEDGGSGDATAQQPATPAISADDITALRARLEATTGSGDEKTQSESDDNGQ